MVAATRVFPESVMRLPAVGDTGVPLPAFSMTMQIVAVVLRDVLLAQTSALASGAPTPRPAAAMKSAAASAAAVRRTARRATCLPSTTDTPKR
jgi:hypothetical protein